MPDSYFDCTNCLSRLKKYLPSQAPLKDFVHHNTLHAFQDMHFDVALRHASRMFGYKVWFTVEEYRKLYKEHKIREVVLEDRIIKNVGKEEADKWVNKLFHQDFDSSHKARIGSLRRKWKRVYEVDLHEDVKVQLFKTINCYLDQGIANWKFPGHPDGFLAALRDLERLSFKSLLKTSRARRLLFDEDLEIKHLLDLLVGDEELYERYLFDQQFSHPGWSGMVAFLEKNPNALFDKRNISLEDFVKFELILEIDALEKYYKGSWKPLSQMTKVYPLGLFEEVALREDYLALTIWHEAYEWSYYDEVLAGISKMKHHFFKKDKISFQALFCIDDREGSLRRYVENEDANCETFGTPGHFGVLTYFKPKQGQFLTKVCPGPAQPKHLVKEIGEEVDLKTEIHFRKIHHHPVWGTVTNTILGYFSGVRLLQNIFRPSASPVASVSFKHMDKGSVLTIAHQEGVFEDGLQLGFKLDEMVDIVRSVLTGIGLVKNFSPLIYVIGHGASSINNTHYAGYDCGACSGRPGSVNARIFSFMANHPEVRKELIQKGITIPENSLFIGGLHDTTRDEVLFFDDNLSEIHAAAHAKNGIVFKQALERNAKERSRKFFDINTAENQELIHDKIVERSVSLFEPRPELNHANNSLCIVGRHSLHEGLFLDRRAFSNSYDYSLDPTGAILASILGAATPVCAGINLEYYFSRMDNQKLGASSKLPHNVMGLIGVSNGLEGDLRTGLPTQMIELHDPIRLMMIVEHKPEVVLNVIQADSKINEWYMNKWLHLVVVEPETYQMFYFDKGKFEIYKPLKSLIDTTFDLDDLINTGDQNIPVHLIHKKN